MSESSSELWGAEKYGDPCRECGFDWSLTPEAAVTQVRHLPDRLAEVTAGANGGERRRAGEWSITEYVAHVGDNLRQWAERVQGARLTGCADVVGYDPDVLARARGYDALALGAALWSAGFAAASWADVLDAALVEGIVLSHATRDRQTAADVARNNAHDAFHHLFDVGRILAPV